MESLSLTTEDLCHHVVRLGMDVYPPIEILSERTRLNMFYEEAREECPELYEQLVVSDTEFRIAKAFRKRPEVRGPSATIDTFVLTNRGPVFAFPIRLPEPVGQLNPGAEEDWLDRFQQVQKLFFAKIPNRTILRFGLVRELVFATGQTPCHELLARETSFAQAELYGGTCLLHYRDDKYNIRVQLAPGQLQTTTQLPVGAKVAQATGYGLQVTLDVNNWEIRPLEDSDIEEVLTRATGLWPAPLLEYLNGRKAL